MMYNNDMAANLQSFFVTLSLLENPHVRRVSLPVVTVSEGDPVRLEFVVAVDSNGNTWMRDLESFTFTSTQQERRRADFEVYSSDFPQNYALDIASVSRSDEGVYTASVPGTLIILILEKQFTVLMYSTGLVIMMLSYMVSSYLASKCGNVQLYLHTLWWW